MSSLSVSHYQSLDSHERKSIMLLSHKLNLVIIIFSFNSDVQIEPRTLFSPHRRVVQPRTKLSLPPIKARSKPWLRKPLEWRKRYEFALDPDIIYEGFEPIRYDTKQKARDVSQKAEKEIFLPKKKERLDNIPARRTDWSVNNGRQTPPPPGDVVGGKTYNFHGKNYYNPKATKTNSKIVHSFEDSTVKNRQDGRSQSENYDQNNDGEWIGWESRRL